MRKKILMILNAPYPSDIRVKKESDALINAGFEVHLLCLRKRNQEYKTTFEGINIHRINAGKNNYQLAFWDSIMSLSSVHPIFKYHIRKIVITENIKNIHVHDLPLCGTALSLKKELKLKVILDMHENYPEALRTWFKWKKNPLVRLKNKLFMNPTRWTAIEKQACEKCDYIIAVVEEMKERIIKEAVVKSEKIIVITNTEDSSFINQGLDHTVYSSLKDKFIITYSGGIGPHRGVDIAIKGMKLLEGNEKIQLAIVGFGSPSVMNSLLQLTKDLNLSNVHFFGYQPFSKFFSYMSLADVNLIPHQSNGHTDNTVPHKLFQGMMTGKPLLVSSSAPLKRLVTEYKSGLVFTAGDENDFAKRIEILFNDVALRKSLGENGYQATVRGSLNWESTQLNLTHLYNSIS